MSFENVLSVIKDSFSTVQYKAICNWKLALFGSIGLSVLRPLYCYIHRKHNKYPPGPIGLPFVGCFFSCVDIPKFASYLASNYGAITMIYVGSQSFVFLHNIKYINEIFKNENALDREWNNSIMFMHLKEYQLNTATAPKKYWERKRKIFQSVMTARLDSDFINKVHNKSFECHVFDSINKCIKQNKLWFCFDDVAYIQFHFIWNAVFGSYTSFDSKYKKNITDLIFASFVDFGRDVSLRYLGIQKVLPTKLAQSLVPNIVKFENYLEKQIYEQLNYDEKVFDVNDKKWDKHFKDIRNNKNSCVASKILAAHRNNPGIDSGKESVLSSLALLFNAGVDTSMNTSEYGVILLAKYPKIQEEIYNELKSVFNNDWKMEKIKFNRVISSLHFLRAFIFEVLRISSVVPIGVAHYNSKCDIWLKNKKYVIPKNSVIISDIPTANRNDLYWIEKTKGNPNKLCLDSWLDINNNFKQSLNKDKMMGFGVGPRDCAGKAMALRSLYLLFIKLILNYKFHLQQKDKNIQIKQKYQFTFVIQPKIGVKVTKRH